MKTMHVAADRQSIAKRIRRLSADSQARWGKFNAPRMVVHLTDSTLMAVGELPVKMRRTPLRFTPIKQLVIYLLPWPKGVPTSPEVLLRAPSAWSGEIEALERVLERFASRSANDTWPAHPAFGTLSTRAWGVLVYRHFDHHLRQFGV